MGVQEWSLWSATNIFCQYLSLITENSNQFFHLAVNEWFDKGFEKASPLWNPTTCIIGTDNKRLRQSTQIFTALTFP